MARTGRRAAVLVSLALVPGVALGAPATQSEADPPADRGTPPPCGRPDDPSPVGLGRGALPGAAEPGEPAGEPEEFAGSLVAGRTYRAEVRCLYGRLWTLRPLLLAYHHSADFTWTNLDDFPELRPEALGTSRRRIVFTVREVTVTAIPTQRRWSDDYRCEILEVEPEPEPEPTDPPAEGGDPPAAAGAR
jgi:hypothetical protein